MQHASLSLNNYQIVSKSVKLLSFKKHQIHTLKVKFVPRQTKNIKKYLCLTTP